MSYVFKKLTEPMPPEAIEWRVQTAGQKDGRVWAKVVPYGDARWLMQRLDEVFGPMNWWDEYSEWGSDGVLCRLTVKVDSQTVSKMDVAGNTQVESVKGGVTDAFKRACVKFNVGNIRALYGSGEQFAQVSKDGSHYQPADRSGKGRYPAFKWDPPAGFKLPDAATFQPSGPAGGDEDEDPAEFTDDSLEGGDTLDLSGPATAEQKDRIHELYLALATALTDAQKKRCKQALEATEEVAGKTIEWMEDKANSLAAAGA